MDAFEARWGKTYPVVVRSRGSNRKKLSPYFACLEAIRKGGCTTTTIEGYDRQLRKVTKAKGLFPAA